MQSTSSTLTGLAAGSDANASGLAGLSGGLTNAAGGKMEGLNVVPLAADIGKSSIEGLAACLNTRDLTYWQDILGFDLSTPAV